MGCRVLKYFPPEIGKKFIYAFGACKVFILAYEEKIRIEISSRYSNVTEHSVPRTRRLVQQMRCRATQCAAACLLPSRNPELRRTPQRVSVVIFAEKNILVQ